MRIVKKREGNEEGFWISRGWKRRRLNFFSLSASSINAEGKWRRMFHEWDFGFLMSTAAETRSACSIYSSYSAHSARLARSTNSNILEPVCGISPKSLFEEFTGVFFVTTTRMRALCNTCSARMIPISRCLSHFEVYVCNWHESACVPPCTIGLWKSLRFPVSLWKACTWHRQKWSCVSPW